MAGIVGATGGAETARGSVEPFPEEPTDVVAVAETAPERHFGDRKISTAQEFKRVVKPQFPQILTRGASGRIAETAEEVPPRHADHIRQLLDLDRFVQMIVHVTDRIADQELRNGRFFRRCPGTAELGDDLHEDRRAEKIPAGAIRIEFRCQPVDFTAQRGGFGGFKMQQRTTDQLRRNRLPWHEQPVKERHPLPVELRQRQLVGIVHQIDQSERRGPVVAVGNSGMDQQHIAGPDLRGAFPDQMLALSGQNQYNLHEGVPVKTPRRMRPHRHLLDVERYRMTRQVTFETVCQKACHSRFPFTVFSIYYFRRHEIANRIVQPVRI